MCRPQASNFESRTTAAGRYQKTIARRRAKDEQRGFALLITLLIMVLLGVTALEFQDFSTDQVILARTLTTRTRLSAAARSALRVGEELLAEDGRQNRVDTLAEDWAAPDPGILLPADFSPAVTVRLTIRDAGGLLRLNDLVTPGSQTASRHNLPLAEIFFRLLTTGPMGISHDRAAGIVAALLDWLDNRDNDAVTLFHGRLGSESPATDFVDHCRNGPLLSLEELLLLNGIDHRLLYGDREHEGIAPYLAILPHSRPEESAININTAPAALLTALSPAVDPDTAQRLIDFRERNPDALSDKNWYRKAEPGLRLEQSAITTHSSLFLLTATATAGGQTVSFRSAVRRQGATISRLFLRPVGSGMAGVPNTDTL